MTKYDNLALLPSVVAVAVANRPYTGAEWSSQHRDSRSVERVEAERQQMTEDDIEAFAESVDRHCRAAYKARARWFVKIARAQDNSGRDQLYVWASHWLAAFLLQPKKRR